MTSRPLPVETLPPVIESAVRYLESCDNLAAASEVLNEHDFDSSLALVASALLVYQVFGKLHDSHAAFIKAITKGEGLAFLMFDDIEKQADVQPMMGLTELVSGRINKPKFLGEAERRADIYDRAAQVASLLVLAYSEVCVISAVTIAPGITD